MGVGLVALIIGIVGGALGLDFGAVVLALGLVLVILAVVLLAPLGRLAGWPAAADFLSRCSDSRGKRNRVFRKKPGFLLLGGKIFSPTLNLVRRLLG
jgi:hypothetical protein